MAFFQQSAHSGLTDLSEEPGKQCSSSVLFDDVTSAGISSEHDTNSVKRMQLPPPSWCALEASPSKRPVPVRLCARDACLGAAFLGLSTDNDSEEEDGQHAKYLGPHCCRAGTSTTCVPRQRLASSFFHSDPAHTHTAQFVTAFPNYDRMLEDPDVAASRAEAAADKANDDAAFALHKATAVTGLAETSITYCYAAVAVACVMAGVGIVNGYIDWKCYKRDNGDVEEMEKSLQTSGWPEYRRRFLTANAAGAAGAQQPSSSSSSSGPRSGSHSQQRGSDY